jgi:DNA N-6-adenine-methyltransferase (Dam)
MFSLKSVEYFAPKRLYEDLNKEFNFILGPCTTSDNPLKTKYFFIKEDDGLTQSWNFKGGVFCNPLMENL